MPTTEADKNLIKRQTQAQDMRNSAADTSYIGAGVMAGATTLHDDIMKIVHEDRSSRGASKMAEDIGTTTGQLVSDPESIRNRTRGMVDPSQVNSLTSNARASNLGTLATQAVQGEYNQGSLSEIIEAGANQLKSKAMQLQAEAERELAKADALMEALKFEQSEKEREFSEWLAREQLSDSRKKSSGSGGGKNGYTESGEKDYSGFYGDAEALREQFQSENIGGNVNAWDNAARQLKSLYPWATDEEITGALHSARPSSNANVPVPSQQSLGGIIEPMKNTFSSGGNVRAAFSPQSLIDSKIEADRERSDILTDAYNSVKNWWNKPKTN